MFWAALGLLSQLPQPIRVNTRLVEVNVVVRDKNGPVTGLTRDDFVLRDRGRIQKIDIFRASSPEPPSAPVEASGFTNAENPRHAVVILWDHINTDFGDGEVARRRAFQAIGQIQTRDRVSLYVLDSQLRVIQDFTSDSSLLVEALRQYREERLDRPVNVPLISGSPAGDPRFGEMIAAFNNVKIAKAAAYRSAVTAEAVRAIANHLAAVPGRKSVLWVAGEVPPAAAALASAGIAVYPVDLSGTSAASPQISQNERAIARRTGGMAFIHSDLRGAIDRAVKDSEAGYTLGFYPDRTPDPINSLKIEVARKGLDLGYRNVYSGAARVPASALVDAMNSPLDATQIKLNVRLTKLGEGWNLAVAIDPSDLTFDSKDGRQTGGLEMALRQISKEGAELATTSNRASLEFDPPRYQVFLSRKHQMNVALADPKPGLATLRLVVQDRVSGRVGSITIPVR